MRDIAKCAKEVEEIRTKTLRIIEAERQHQFSVGIKESREILDTITSSLTRLTTARLRNAPYDSIPSDNEVSGIAFRSPFVSSVLFVWFVGL
ncbi:hypothetical protein K438DRAFT_1982112 [Mycena galopus ATCC 62051]|nr:hypothetical protein K438DRAFT_1982112 [Mycena galopus ATCC 62051]